MPDNLRDKFCQSDNCFALAKHSETMFEPGMTTLQSELFSLNSSSFRMSTSELNFLTYS